MMSRERIIRFAIGAYCILTLPLVLVALKSEYVRFVAIQMVANWKGKLSGISSAFVGDSITAGGRNWGTVLGAINLAGDSYTVWQVEGQLGKAEKYSPERIFILAGTNDILGRRPFDLKQFELDYTSFLDRAMGLKAEIYVTLIPLTARSEANTMIPLANETILRLATGRGIPTIDLNPTIAPAGTLLPQYTVDGVHFSDAAYDVWRMALEAAIRKHKAEQDAP
jgi:lysophospholipase L1-like esterase